ncbi:hypothetical protein V9T40_007512 [Parthenolecanium corni]|uniref:Uncharacterized protein n=1 Tax=Parthenolecanium corni TaxID=536013 RepID=A0AAN9TVG2_9HEMI
MSEEPNLDSHSHASFDVSFSFFISLLRPRLVVPSRRSFVLVYTWLMALGLFESTLFSAFALATTAARPRLAATGVNPSPTADAARVGKTARSRSAIMSCEDTRRCTSPPPPPPPGLLNSQYARALVGRVANRFGARSTPTFSRSPPLPPSPPPPTATSSSSSSSLVAPTLAATPANRFPYLCEGRVQEATRFVFEPRCECDASCVFTRTRNS